MRHFAKKFVLFGALVLSAFFVGGTCRADGLVSGYDVVVLGNFSSQNTDLAGTVAVRGNLTLQNFTLNQSAPNPNTVSGGFDTVVGGKLSATNGTLDGKTFASSISLTNVNACANCVSTGSTSPLDFASLSSQVKQTSSFLYQLAPTGMVTLANTELYLNGSGKSGLEVFSIDASEMSSASTLDITNLASNASVIVNVTGSGHVSTSAGGLEINGIQVNAATNVLFNFSSSVSQIDITNGFYASMLAPNADVTGGNGAFNGDLVAGSYTGNDQFDREPFTGNVPNPPACAPEPASIGMTLGAGVLAIGISRLKRRKQAR